MRSVESGWNELERALRNAWIDGDSYTTYMMAFYFTRWDGGRRVNDEIGIFIPEDIDNCYDREKGWRWEIKLHKNGTWEIA